MKLLTFIIQIYLASPAIFAPSTNILSAIGSILQVLIKPDAVNLLNSIHLYKF